MIIHKGFKYRLEPTAEQRQQCILFAGHNRAVWNKALDITNKILEQYNVAKETTLHSLFPASGIRVRSIAWYNELNWMMTKLWKPSENMGWLKEAPSQTLQQTLMQFERALKDCFDKNQPNKRFPRHKRKGRSVDSFRFPNGKAIETDGNRVKLPKLGFIHFRKSRPLVGAIKNATVSRNGKHWFISIMCEIEVDEPVHPSSSAVGIDRGVKVMAACSDGENFMGAKAFRSLEGKLRRQQRLLSRKTKFSNNWKKQLEKIQAVHSKISNMRKDALHKASSIITNNHGMVVLEKLGVARMSKSAKGNNEKHGKNVAAKSGLNKSILDAGWSMFESMLQYKQKWKGGYVEFVPAPYTSQKCSCCDNIDKESRVTQSKFVCTSCGFSMNADTNAAINILNASGYGVQACGVTALAESMKQESSGNSDIALPVAA